MPDVLDKTYLPFTCEELIPHFITDVDGQLAYFQKSASRYHEFMGSHPETAGIPITQARIPRQIEKDERFWTITATKHIFDDPLRNSMLVQLLERTYGSIPPISDISSWEECLEGDLRLYFEVRLPSPSSYLEWLRSNLSRRQMIPYILDAAAREDVRTLEGATQRDAMFLNVTNGFAWLIEAKALSDVSYMISFDNSRNQTSGTSMSCLTIRRSQGRDWRGEIPSGACSAYLHRHSSKRAVLQALRLADVGI